MFLTFFTATSAETRGGQDTKKTPKWGFWEGRREPTLFLLLPTLVSLMPTAKTAKIINWMATVLSVCRIYFDNHNHFYLSLTVFFLGGLTLTAENHVLYNSYINWLFFYIYCPCDIRTFSHLGSHIQRKCILNSKFEDVDKSMKVLCRVSRSTVSP